MERVEILVLKNPHTSKQVYMKDQADLERQRTVETAKSSDITTLCDLNSPTDK